VAIQDDTGIYVSEGHLLVLLPVLPVAVHAVAPYTRVVRPQRSCWHKMADRRSSAHRQLSFVFDWLSSPKALTSCCLRTEQCSQPRESAVQ
jgi:hypothetical protein